MNPYVRWSVCHILYSYTSILLSVHLLIYLMGIRETQLDVSLVELRKDKERIPMELTLLEFLDYIKTICVQILPPRPPSTPVSHAVII